eukprot:155801-Rhodomonas_salina.1
MVRCKIFRLIHEFGVLCLSLLPVIILPSASFLTSVVPLPGVGKRTKRRSSPERRHNDRRDRPTSSRYAPILAYIADKCAGSDDIRAGKADLAGDRWQVDAAEKIQSFVRKTRALQGVREDVARRLEEALQEGGGRKSWKDMGNIL